MTWSGNEDDWQRLLHWLSALHECEPAKIRATAAWRKYSGSGDALDVVESVLDLEDEHPGATGGRA